MTEAQRQAAADLLRATAPRLAWASIRRQAAKLEAQRQSKKEASE